MSKQLSICILLNYYLAISLFANYADLLPTTTKSLTRTILAFRGPEGFSKKVVVKHKHMLAIQQLNTLKIADPRMHTIYD